MEICVSLNIHVSEIDSLKAWRGDRRQALFETAARRKSRSCRRSTAYPFSPFPGSSSMNGVRINRSFRSKGTVQSNIVLRETPASRMERLYSGLPAGSSGWRRTPGMAMMSTCSSTGTTRFCSANAGKAGRAACLCAPSSVRDFDALQHRHGSARRSDGRRTLLQFEARRAPFPSPGSARTAWIGGVQFLRRAGPSALPGRCQTEQQRQHHRQYTLHSAFVCSNSQSRTASIL